MQMMKRMNVVTSLALAMAAAACGGKASDSATAPSVAETQQETRSSGQSAAKGEHDGMCEDKAMSPEWAEGKQLLEAKNYGEAAAKFEAIAAANPKDGHAVMMQGYALHAAGRLDEALAVHERAAQFPEVRPVALYNAACVHALKGETDKAFATLDESIKAGFSSADHMKKDDDLKSLRSDPRFDTALKAAAANPQKDMKKGSCEHEHAKK
jgi:Flp pilus assembly protein TadD